MMIENVLSISGSISSLSSVVTSVTQAENARSRSSLTRADRRHAVILRSQQGSHRSNIDTISYLRNCVADICPCNLNHLLDSLDRSPFLRYRLADLRIVYGLGVQCHNPQ